MDEDEPNIEVNEPIEEPKVLKYATHISTNVTNPESCSGTTYEEIEIQAFRWTFNEIDHPNNFLPRALLLEDDNEQKQQTISMCEGWSLSFFKTEAQAEAKLRKHLQRRPELALKLGSHIAGGKIYKDDGTCGSFATNGHFEHFEYSDRDLTKNFFVIKPIVI